MHKIRINDFDGLEILAVKLISVFTDGKERNVSSIQKE